jgi:hypothetical protein
MQQSNLLISSMHVALLQREAPAELVRDDAAILEANRAPPAAEATWEATVALSLEEARALNPDSQISKSCRLVAGDSAQLLFSRA